jgi:hypothetical protein
MADAADRVVDVVVVVVVVVDVDVDDPAGVSADDSVGAVVLVAEGGTAKGVLRVEPRSLPPSASIAARTAATPSNSTVAITSRT